MRKYFIHDGVNQNGPYTIEELKNKNLSKSTPIWYEGIETWTTIENVDGLAGLINQNSPPPFQSPASIPPAFKTPLTPKKKQLKQKRRSKSWRILLFIIIGIFIIIGGIALVNVLKNNSKSADSGTYEEKVMTIEEMEKADPSKYLEASGTYKETFFGDNFKIEGTITNNATVAKYKDVVVEIIFYSGTDTELQRERYIIYDYFPAHETKKFELKVGIPPGAKKPGWKAINATAY